MKKLYLVTLLIMQLALATKTNAQNVAINATGSLPDNSAMLDISSTEKGFLAPRLTTTQQNAITLPATGLLIFNTTDNVFKVNTGTPAIPLWTPLATGSGLSGTGYPKFAGSVPTYITAIPNADLANSAITIQGTPVSLGGTVNLINGTGFVKASGTTISYDNNTYLTSATGRTNISLTTTGTSGAATYDNLTGVLNIPSYAAGTGTVTSASVLTANGFIGTVATATTTPAITLGTTITGILKGNGSAMSAAIASDFPILNQNTTGNAATVTNGVYTTTFNTLGDARYSLLSHNHTLDGLSNLTITSKATGDLLKWNGTKWVNFAPSYISSYTETDPIVKAINGIVKSNGTTIAAAVAADFPVLNQNTTGNAATVTNGVYTTTFNTLGDARYSLLSHNHTLDGLSNITITSKATGDLLKWNGTAWVNFAPNYISSYTETDPIVKAINGMVKSNGTTISAAAAGTDYTTPSSTETVTNKNLTSATNTFPTFNQNTTGTAANVTGIVAVPNGGTGLNSVTTGDLLYGSAANTYSKLPAGTNGQILTLAGGIPSWSANPGSTAWSLTGNTATAGSHFLGATNNVSLRLRTNNIERMVIDSLGYVGIGVSDPNLYSNQLVVKDNLEIRRVGSIGQLIFTKTAGSGDFRIAGDGGDIFWQGGGGRSLQMGSYWATILGGDRQNGTLPAFSGGVSGTSVIVASQRDASVALGVQANSGSQTANLTEWRNSAGTTLSAIDKNGFLGIGVTSPSAYLHLKAGNATAGNAPLKLTAGVNLSTPEDGAVEYNGTHFYGTVGTTRYQLDQQAPASFSGSLAGDVTGTQSATVVGKINGTALSGLATGILKNTTGTGVPSIAIASDFPIFNQNTTGTAANVTGIVAVPNGGTGLNSVTTGDLLYGSAANTYSKLPAGTNGQVLTLNAGIPSWSANPGSTAWNLTGNAATAGSHFLGTTNNISLRLRTNNIERMLIDSTGKVGIGTNALTEALNVNGNVALSTAAAKVIGNAGNLTFEQNGDAYGTTRLSIQNRTGVNGAMFEQAGTVDLVDFVFKGLTSQRNIRYENRAAYSYTGNLSPEFQIGIASDPTFVVADNSSVFRRGTVGIGGILTPTALLHLGAGTASAGTAPLKFAAGVNLTAPENGAVEFNGTHFYGTVGSTRYQLDQQAPTSFTGSLSGDVTGTQSATVVGKINGVSLAGLGTGILKNTTATGIPSIAVAADFPTLNQNTTGTASNITGTVAVANGGTGLTSVTTGDLLYGSAANIYSKLPAGTNGQVLTLTAGIPSWVSSAASNAWTLTGNTVTAGSHFLGSTNNVSLRMRTNNVERMVIDSTGNVGIGTIAPTSILTLSGANKEMSLYNSNDAAYSYFGNWNNLVQMAYNRRTSDGVISNTSRTSSYINMFGASGSGYISFNTSNTNNIAPPEVMRIDGAGHIGIGTTSASALLHLKAGTASANSAPLKFTSGTILTTPEDGAVEYNGTHFYGTIGSTRYQLDQQATGADWSLTGNAATAGSSFLGSTNNVSLRLRTNNTERMVIDSIGRAGIGTNKPTAILEVNNTSNPGTAALKLRYPLAGSSTDSLLTWNPADSSVRRITTSSILSSVTLPLMLANGTATSTTSIRDYDAWVTQKTYGGNFVTDVQNTITNGIPNEGAWFALSNVGTYPNSSGTNINYFGQTSLNDHNFYFRGGTANTSTGVITSPGWQKMLSIPASSQTKITVDGSNNANINVVDNASLTFSTNNAGRVVIDNTGNVGIGVTAPSATLHLEAGTAAANTAPLKFTTGVNLATPENGAVEFSGTHFYGTVGTTRYQLDQQSTTFTGSLAGDVTGTQSATVVGKINGVSLAGLSTGILKNTTTTGVPSIAVAADFPTLNQNTTGTAANVTGTVAVANGGTGVTSVTDGGILYGATSTTIASTAVGSTGQVLQSAAAGVPVWVNGGTMMFSGNTLGTNQGTNTTRYYPINGTQAGSGTYTSVSTASLMSRAGTIANLVVKLSANANSNTTYTILKNGTAQTMTITVASGSTTGSTTTNPVSFAAGDEIAIRIVTANGGATAVLHGWACDVTY